MRPPGRVDRRLLCSTEVYEHLVGSAAFKAVETGDPRLAGSIPVHLRHLLSVPSTSATLSADGVR